jgi:RecA/RadA recombinase
MATRTPAKKSVPTRKTTKAAPLDISESQPKARKVKFDAAAAFSGIIDDISKRQGFESSGLDVAPPMSTGYLEIDLIMGGGVRASMVTAAGNEQCAKTTLALGVMAASIKADIPVIAFVDFEGSTKNSKPYVQSILNTCGLNLTVDQVFGKKAKDGTWAIRPRVRYRSETILEYFYDWVSELLRDLPDKKYVEGKWWMVFDEKNKKQKAMAGEFVDREMTRKYGNGLWVEAPDDKIQGIIFLDSYTAMQPKIKDEEEIGNQLSVKASAFSKQLERVKGRMAEKMVTIYGLNHLRSNPMAMFGPKEDEKGGNALKQFSDVRLRQTSRSLSAAPFSPKADKNFDYNESERSVEFKGGLDVYRYVHVKAHKNKLWTPGRTGFFRIWVRDGNGQARGIDPVFDTIHYLKKTGQLKGSRKAFKLNFKDLGPSKSAVSWEELKLWVLGSKEDMVAISKKAGYSPMNLRKFCFTQMAKGVGEDLFIAQENSRNPGEDDGGSDE